MSTAFKRGDRVDFRGHRNGEVMRVGRATVWALFQTCHGSFPTCGPVGEFRRHVPSTAVQVGEYVIGTVCGHEDKVQLHLVTTGEMMETDIAQLESWLAKFWRKEF